jgi:hypothetical protein
LSPIRLGDGESVKFLRVFGIGLYKGGLRRLLLRADKTDTNPTRIDVLFMNTQHLSLPTTMEGLEIVDVTDSGEGQSLLQECRISVYEGTRVRTYLLHSNSCDGHVIAGSAAYLEDAGEYWEPSGFDMDP